MATNPQVRIPYELMDIIKARYPFLDANIIAKQAIIEFFEKHKDKLNDHHLDELKKAKTRIIVGRAKTNTVDGYTVSNYIRSLLRKIGEVNYSTIKIWEEHEIFVKETENILIPDEKRHLTPFTKRHIKDLRCSLIEYKVKNHKGFFFFMKYPDYILLMEELTKYGLNPAHNHIMPEGQFIVIEDNHTEDQDEYTT